MKLKHWIAGLCILMSSMSAWGYAFGSSALDYNLIDIRYDSLSLDGYEESGASIDTYEGDGNGIGLHALFEVNDFLHVRAKFVDVDMDFDLRSSSCAPGVVCTTLFPPLAVERDITQFSVGLGYHTPLAPGLDGLVELSFENQEVAGLDDSGFGLRAGLRGQAARRIELYGYVSYVDAGQFSDATLVQGGGLYRVSPLVSVGVEGGWGSDQTTFALIGRFHFSEE